MTPEMRERAHKIRAARKSRRITRRQSTRAIRWQRVARFMREGK